MKKVGITLGILVIVIVLISAYFVFGPTIRNADNKALFIPTNGTLENVHDSLIHNDIKVNSLYFNLLASRVNLDQDLKPGKYLIPSGSSIFQIVKKLKRGAQDPVNVVITKIRTKEKLAARLAGYLELDSAAIMHFFSSNNELKPFDVDTATVLADVIPDTYTYYWTADMPTVFKKLYDEHKKFWNEERVAQAEALGLTPIEVQTIASIIEEETNKKEDKSKIASVYLNRLDKGMPLQADPTVKFAMRDFALTRILHKHLQYPSPYNTYINKGLPPGPIGTATRETLEAVLNAPKTDYLYFVAKPDFSGYSNFAENYTQHLQFAKAYQTALDSLIARKANK